MYRRLDHHLPGLDGLRGVAALVVVVSHCAYAGYLPAEMGRSFGQMGVALFYGLSGFVMMHTAIDQGWSRASLRRYALARASRVLPLFYLVLAVATLVFVALGKGLYDIAGWVDLALNWLLLRGTGVLWSIPVEVHFYMAFPALWWAHARGRFAAAALVLLAGCGLLAAVAPDPRVNELLPFWLHFFVMGAGLRWLLDDGQRNRLSPLQGGRGALVAAWLLFAALALLPPDLREALGQPRIRRHLDPMAVAMVPLLLWFGVARTGPFGLFTAPLLRWYGKISYGLYLIHAPVLAGFAAFSLGARLGPTAAFIGVLGVSTLAAALSFYLFERPVQSALRRRFDRPSTAAQA